MTKLLFNKQGNPLPHSGINKAAASIEKICEDLLDHLIAEGASPLEVRAASTFLHRGISTCTSIAILQLQVDLHPEV